MLKMDRKSLSKVIHISSLSGLGMFLPLSEYMTSVFLILLSLNWLVNFRPALIFGRLKEERLSLLFLLTFVVYIFWILNSQNYSVALGALKLKLPILAITLTVLSTPLKEVSERKIIIYSFILGVTIASVLGSVSWALNHESLSDRRDMALYISHIRLSLMLIMAASMAFYIALKTANTYEKWVLFLLGIWNIVFMFMLLSFTGIIISAAIVLFLITRIVCRTTSKVIRYALPAAVFITVCVLCFFVVKELKDLFPEQSEIEINYNELTLSGDTYLHYPERNNRENGYYVWRYLAYPEMSKEWNRLSKIAFDSLDNRGHKLEYTLIRYLSSKGLRKDSLGVSSLRPADISLIEAGYANNIYLEAGAIRIKLYELFWQIDYYQNGGNPQGHSLTQRIEFWTTTLRVSKENMLFGTGTGDYKDEIRKQYEEDQSLLEKAKRRSAHNQYLLSLATFGILGALIFWFGMLSPIISRRAKGNILFYIFLIVGFMSMIWEDTLETHTGVSFFVWMYFVTLYYSPDGKDLKLEDS